MVSTITRACDTHIPKIKVTQGRSSKWFTQEIRHLINKIHTQRRRLLKNNTIHRNSLISSLELELEHKIYSARSAYLQRAVASFSDNPRKLYDHLKHLSKGDQTPLTIVHNSSQITDAAVQAKLFNEYFHSVYTTSNYTLPPVDELPSPPNHIADVSISEEDVDRAFSSLVCGKAPGCDG